MTHVQAITSGLPQLRSITILLTEYCRPEVAQKSPPVLTGHVSRSLRSLTLTPGETVSTVTGFSDGLLVSGWAPMLGSMASACPHLTHLQIGFSVDSIALLPLLALSQLTWLSLAVVVSVDAMDVVRRMTQLKRFGVGKARATYYERLTAEHVGSDLTPPPQLEYLEHTHVCDGATVTALSRFTHITKVQTLVCSDRFDPVPLFTAWTHLTDLTLTTVDHKLEFLLDPGQRPSNDVEMADLLLPALRSCTSLTHLSLTCPALTSAHLEGVLPSLTHLKRLQLFESKLLSSLSFLSDRATNLPGRLEELTLADLSRMSIMEALHLYSLRRLRRLELHRCFDHPFDDLSRASFTPDARGFRADCFPRLHTFEYRPAEVKATEKPRVRFGGALG